MAEAITTDSTLRGLLRTARHHAKLSQKEAAEKAGCSPSWWRRVESASEVNVAPDKMANMLDAVGVLPEHLEIIHRPVLAELLRERQAFEEISQDGEGLEEYLMRAPAPRQLREELIAYVRARTAQPFRYRSYRTEPFADQFRPG